MKLANYTTVTCIHNEHQYIGSCLQSILNQTRKPAKTIVVLDRCTNGSETEVAKYPIDLVICKDKVGSWNNSMSENLELAWKHVKSPFYAIVDADTILPPDYFETLLRNVGDTVIVSGQIVTDSPNLLGKLVKLWERTYKFAPIGRYPRGCALMISRDFIDEIGGFPDMPAFETELIKQAQTKGKGVTIVPQTKAYHARKLTISNVVARQIRSGKARRQQHWPLWKTILHAIFRFRPFVLWGYFLG